MARAVIVDHGGPVKLNTRASVLLVDDVRDVREMYERYLRFVGMDVSIARDGVEALQAAHFGRHDVIVLDLTMPRMTGWEALAILKRDARTRNIPVIVLTGHVAASTRDEVIDLGADGYATKPCLPEALLAEIRRVLLRPHGRGSAA